MDVGPPSELTNAQVEWILADKMTLDEAAAQNRAKDERRKAITPEMVESKFRQLSDDSIASGEADALDWVRDEVFAEQWANGTESINLDNIRRGMPPGGYFADFAEGLLAAQANVLRALGVKLDPQTGAVVRPQLFAENPLVGTDAKVRRRLEEYAGTHRAWLRGNLDMEARGARLAPRGRAEELKNSPYVRLQDAGNGVRENEFLREVDGQLIIKPQKEIDNAHKSRAQQLDEMRKGPLVTADDNTVGPRRRSDGAVVVSGEKLPRKFDYYATMPVHLRRFARMLEKGAEAGESFLALYHSIGSGEPGAEDAQLCRV